MASLKDISNFFVLLFLFLYIEALLGLELFAETVKFDIDEKLVKGEEILTTYAEGRILKRYDANFDTIYNAICTVLMEVMCENWNDHMDVHTRAYTGINVIPILFFVQI